MNPYNRTKLIPITEPDSFFFQTKRRKLQFNLNVEVDPNQMATVLEFLIVTVIAQFVL
jgi:hypothetical protein